jgi:hypothetical protein
MSYEIVQSIRFIGDRVFLSADSNNVSPRDYTLRESKYLTSLLASDGKDGVILSILHGYESGGLQPGRENKYSRAIDRLRTMPEYAAFDWRASNWDEVQENRRSNPEALNALLWKALAL